MIKALWGGRRARWLPFFALLLPLFVAMPRAQTHDSLAYSHDSTLGTRLPDWMAALPDSARISELSIPGTHDTMALYGGDQVQCQSAALSEQLQAGIRVLDIRNRHISNRFLIHHGDVYQNAEFGSGVLEPVIVFLTAHPSETVLMRVKKEYKDQNDTRTFDETFDWYLSKYGHWVWKPDSLDPTLGEVRGKIVILDNFSAGGRYGLPWGDAKIQDNFHLNANLDLYGKWEGVKAHLYSADSGSSDDIYINFLSGAIGVRPYFVASGHSAPATRAGRQWTGLLWDNQTGSTCGSSGCYPEFPRLNCRDALGARTCRVYFAGTNELTLNLLQEHKISRRTGIVMMDFPGGQLIKSIVELNR